MMALSGVGAGLKPAPTYTCSISETRLMDILGLLQFIKFFRKKICRLKINPLSLHRFLNRTALMTNKCNYTATLDKKPSQCFTTHCAPSYGSHKAMIYNRLAIHSHTFFTIPASRGIHSERRGLQSESCGLYSESCGLYSESCGLYSESLGASCGSLGVRSGRTAELFPINDSCLQTG